MYPLKDYQETAVQRLTDATCELLPGPRRRQSILLKAPTGAGKTIVMAAYISRLVEELRLRGGGLPREVAFVWMAPQTLHLQSYTALKGFYDTLRDMQTLQVEDLDPREGLPPSSLLFLNWASVDKDKNTFRRENERGFNLDSVMLQTLAAGTEVIVVVDEAHISAFKGEQAQKVLAILNGKIEVHVTATPPLRNFDETVNISRDKVIAAQMIKKGVRINPDVDAGNQDGSELELYLLRQAVKKRAEIAMAYEKAGSTVNPLLLIQLPSEIQALTEEDKRLKAVLESYLEGEFDISAKNHRLAIWLSDSKDKINLEGIERPGAMQQVLIFKQAIALGWDCPRAAVLLTFRELGNRSFGIQTVGRILRMPEQKHYNDELLDYGTVYTNIETRVIEIVPDDQDYISTKMAYRRDGLHYPMLSASNMVNDRETPGFLGLRFIQTFFERAERELGLVQLPADLFTQADEAVYQDRKAANHGAFRSKFWNMDIADIQVTIPADIQIDSYEQQAIVVDASHEADFSKTQNQLMGMMQTFCYKAVTSLNKGKSWKMMRRTLIEFAEYYAGLDEYETRKWYLEPNNNALLVHLIDGALRDYDDWQREQGNKHRRRVESTWEVPERRAYPGQYKEDDTITAHALEPYYEYGSSSPEKAFTAVLETAAESIEWWYKNGDKGREHFAITYTDAGGREAVFYPDFILRFRNGRIGIFDTKSLGSDPLNAWRKHNALIAYLEHEKSQNGGRQQYVGGVILQDTKLQGAPFRFSHAHIADTTDLTGWEFFDPRTYNQS